jgi:hypothetical protein
MRLVLDARTAAFGGLIDYAGVFPPASLSMQQAVDEYLDVRTARIRWITGRFLCRASQLESLAAVATSQLRSGDEPWKIGVIFDMGAGAAATLCNDFQAEMSPAMSITVVEAKTTRSDPPAIAQLAETIGSFDHEASLFIEVVRDGSLAEQIDAIAENLRSRGRTGGAKLRCGGLATDDFPSVDTVTEFLWEAALNQLPFKATAGLHQPIRHHDDGLGVWRHGFMNILMASVACDEGEDMDTVAAIVAETDPSAFSMSATAARWRDLSVPGSALRRSRKTGFVAYGSCDLAEPITALRDLNFLGDGS